MFCRQAQSTVVKAAVAESSQDMDDMDAELEEELEDAYQDEIPMEKIPGIKASAYAGRKGRQSESTGGRRQPAEDALQERVLQV